MPPGDSRCLPLRPPEGEGGGGSAPFTMDHTSDEEAEVKRLKSYTDELKLAGCPLFMSAHETESLDPNIRAKYEDVRSYFDNLMGDVRQGFLEQDALFDTLRLLTAQGETLDKFKQQMMDLDFSEKCNSIWENDAVAYRCNTCALTPCMSLCAPCFLAGNHVGHDFTRFFSREGGACDCGNADVLKVDGFCVRHGPSAPRPASPSPVTVSLPEHIVCRLLIRLFCMYRGWSERFFGDKGDSSDENEVDMVSFSEGVVQKSGKIVAFLQECVNMGGPLRDAIASILIDKPLYTALTERTSQQDIDDKGQHVDVSLDWRTLRLLEEDKQTLCDYDELRRKFDIDPNLLKFECLLDELIFWIVRLTFPQSLINLSLGMLSGNSYRDQFAFRFFAFYPCSVDLIKQICALTEKKRSINVSPIACRIIHISVQMLSSEALCLRLDDEISLVNTVLGSVFYLLTSDCVESKMTIAPLFRNLTDAGNLEDVVRSGWPVISCQRNPVFLNHGYWFVMGDLQNLLSHHEIATRVVRSHYAFISCYVALIRRMQGMNQCYRIVTGDHRENDTHEQYQRAFTLEFETSAISMFNMVLAVAYAGSASVAAQFLAGFKEALQEWFVALNYPRFPPLSCPPFNVSFHLPLHRHLSTALTHFTSVQNVEQFVDTIRTDVEFLKKLILHPIRIQAARVEYQCGMWVRNGSQMRMQTMLYSQQHLSTALLVPDMDLIRYCAANLPANWVWECILESFHLQDAFEWTTRQQKKIIVNEASTSEFPPSTAASTSTVADPPSDVSIGVEVYGEPMDVEAGGAVKDTLPSLTSDGSSIVASVSSAASGDGADASGPGAILSGDILEPFPPSDETYRLELDEEGNYSNAPKQLITAPDPNGPLSDVSWRGPKLAEVLIRPEWVDPLLAGALRLIAQCVVLRGNSGSTYRELIRDELVYALSEGDYPHSRLRTCVPEKGSRGTEGAENIFEEVLKEIADFREPDANRQGTYRLKRSAWTEFFCPVFVQLRASSAKQWNAVLNRVEQIDRDSLSRDMKDSKNGKLWIPYRLVPFHADYRHSSIRGVCRLLSCDRFFEMSAIIIKTFSTSKLVLDHCVQLVVYLLSLCVVYAETLSEHEREKVMRKIHLEWNYRRGDGKPGKMSVFTAVNALFCELLPTKKDFSSRIRKELESAPQARIVGTGVDYVARLLNLLYRTDYRSRVLLDGVVSREGEHLSSMVVLDEETKEKEERRQLAKKRMEMLMARAQKKNSETMQRMMEKEGISQRDMDAIDTSQPSVRLYECPICGDSTPSTISQPLGLLVCVTENDIVGQQVGADEPELSLMEMDDRFGSVGQWSVRRTLRMWEEARLQLAVTVKPYHGVVETDTACEVKTCGHYAHVSCFTAYLDTLHLLDVREVAQALRFDVSCPMCRFKVNAQVPLAFDFGFETASRHEEMSVEKARDELVNAVVDWKKKFTESGDEETFRRHYSRSLSLVVGMRTGGLLEEHSTVHNHIAALIRSNVERNLLLSVLNAPERRRNTRTLIVEHLSAALVARTTPTDRNLLLCSIRDLLTPNYFMNDQDASPSCSSPPETDAPDSPSTSGSPSPIPEALSSTESDSLLDDLVDIDDIKDSLHVLRGSRSVVKRTPRDPLKKKSDVPILLYDVKGILVKITCYVLERSSLTKDEKIQLARIVASACYNAAQTRCALQLIVRGTLEAARATSRAEGVGGQLPLLADVARSLLGCRTFVDQSAFADADAEVPNYSRDLAKSSESFVRFVAQFWHESKLLVLPEGVDAATSDIEVLRNSVGDFSLRTPGADLVDTWVQQMAPIIPYNRATSFKVLTREPLVYRPFVLLDLPPLYDDLFSRFFNRQCLNCATVPSSPFVCLLCSQLVCFGDCCKTLPDLDVPSNEVERHAVQCGSGYAPFISINSSLIVFVKENQGMVWGTVYLDSHGEEDRNLRRGKPLYLSEQRWRALCCDWIEKDTSRAFSPWESMELLARQIRDSHYYFERMRV